MHTHATHMKKCDVYIIHTICNDNSHTYPTCIQPSHSSNPDPPPHTHTHTLTPPTLLLIWLKDLITRLDKSLSFTHLPWVKKKMKESNLSFFFPNFEELHLSYVISLSFSDSKLKTSVFFIFCFFFLSDDLNVLYESY